MSVQSSNKCALYVNFSGSTYTQITQLVGLTPPSPSREPIETTNLDSTRKTFRMSNLADYGELSGSMQYNPDVADHASFWGMFLAGTVYPMHVVYDDPTVNTVSFDGGISGWNPQELSGPDDANVLVDFTIKLCGGVDLAIA